MQRYLRVPDRKRSVQARYIKHPHTVTELQTSRYSITGIDYDQSSRQSFTLPGKVKA